MTNMAIYLNAIGEVDHPALILGGPPFVFNKWHRQRRRVWRMRPRHDVSATRRHYPQSQSPTHTHTVSTSTLVNSLEIFGSVLDGGYILRCLL